MLNSTCDTLLVPDTGPDLSVHAESSCIRRERTLPVVMFLYGTLVDVNHPVSVLISLTNIITCQFALSVSTMTSKFVLPVSFLCACSSSP